LLIIFDALGVFGFYSISQYGAHTWGGKKNFKLSTSATKRQLNHHLKRDILNIIFKALLHESGIEMVKKTFD